MKANEVITLLNAGYTKEEIENFKDEAGAAAGEAGAADEAGAAAGEAGAAAADEADKDPAAAQAAATAKWLKEVSDNINKEIEKLKKAYEEYNLNQANSMEKISKGSTEILGELLYPPTYDKEGDK